MRRRKSRREEAEVETLRRGEEEEGEGVAPEVRGLVLRRGRGDGRSGLKEEAVFLSGAWDIFGAPLLRQHRSRGGGGQDRKSVV